MTPIPASDLDPRARHVRAAGGRRSRAVSAEIPPQRFGDRVAFDDVSFEIGHGEVFGFLGPNGAGKTTTVRTLGTLIAPTSGSATVAGIPLAPENGVEIRRPHRDHAGDARALPAPERGREPRVLRRPVRRCHDPRDRIERALQAVNMTDRAGDACGTLSKGLRQRVALARAAAQRPGRAVPRRADRRPRSGGRAGRPRVDRGARAQRA